MDYKEEIKKEYKQLLEQQDVINSEGFKTLIKPLQDELNGLKYAYDCKSLEELAFLKGKKKGLEFLNNLIREVESRIITLKSDIDRYDKES